MLLLQSEAIDDADNLFFFFKEKTAYGLRISDWSSDVCSSDLLDSQGASGAIRNEGGRPSVLPEAPLAVESLGNFDADVRYRVARIRADYFPISNVDLTLDLERSRLSLSPLTFDIAGGRMASDIIINARERPVATDYDIRLSPTPMGNLLAKLGVDASSSEEHT